ncbi:MAG: response regulator [Vicinamibacterales bacterium]
MTMQPFATRRMSVPLNDQSPDADSGTLRRVLFVSADADLRSVVSRVLECEDYQVEAVAHSGHALLLCRTRQFDVMVTELSCPEMSGPSLADQVRRHCPRLSVIYLGNPGTPEGVDHVLVRPFTRDDLLERIHLVLSGVAA